MASRRTTPGLSRPPRTVGVSLAILASGLLFSILPLLQLGLLLLIQYRFANVDLTVPGQTDSVAPVAVGGDFTGIDNRIVILQTILGVIFLAIAVFAWRGRPAWIRFVMLAAVLGLTLITVGLSVAPLLAQSDPGQGLDSGEALWRTLLSGRLLLSILVAFYVVWYMNRGPARAFYRGYYLEAPPATASQ